MKDRWLTYTLSILKVFSDTTLWESIEGDLTEMYLADRSVKSKYIANWKLLVNAVAFLRFRRLRKRKQSKSTFNMDLLFNYLKVGIRDIRRHTLFSVVNLIGLTISMTASIFILQYVVFENSFDLFHHDFKKIYRVFNDRFQNGSLVQHGTITYPTIGPQLYKDYPEVTDYTRLTLTGRNYFSHNNEIYMTDDGLIADERFLSFFTFPVLHGDKSSALSVSGNIALSESFGRKLLTGEEQLEDLIGQPVMLNDYGMSGNIQAIFADVPANSHLQFDVLVSYESFISAAGEGADNSWEWSDFYHYVKLDQRTDPAVFQKKLDEFGQHYFKSGEVSGAEERFFLQPLSEAHLFSDFEYEIGVVRDGRVVWMLLATAIFIMIMAWINYINLTVSRGIDRAKEVGIRKALGAFQGQVIRQFLAESLIINFVALLLSIVLVKIFQPYFNVLTGLTLESAVLWQHNYQGIPWLLIVFAVFMLVLLLIGTYPSMLVARAGFGGKQQEFQFQNNSQSLLRKILVVFQFSTAVVLIACTFSVNRQITYMQTKDLGFDMENTLALHGPRLSGWDSTFITKFRSFRGGLTSIPGVQQVSSSGRTFGMGMGKVFRIQSPAAPEVDNISANFVNVDHAFFDLFGVNLKAGRMLNASDHNIDGNLVNTMIINEKAMHELRFRDPEATLHQKITYWGKDWEIVGIVENYHQRGLQNEILPILYLPYYNPENYILLKLDPANLEETLAAIETKFNEYYPGNYYEYFFPKDRFQREYVSDERLSQIAEIFAIIAVIIGVLGLHGLVLTTVNSKTKEIGIRKVLGASLPDLLNTIGRTFLILICIAIIIGLPVSYLLISEWIKGYEFNIGVDWQVLLVAGLILLFIATVTILVQTRKISLNNPVDSLKYE